MASDSAPQVVPGAAEPERLGIWWALFGVGVASRLLLAFGTEPYSDEAYYRLWAEHPALGYYDHPPFIAWLLALIPSIRGAALVVSALTLLALGGLAKRLHGTESARLVAMALGAVLPAAILGGTFATIDAPLQLFWVLALWALAAERDWLAGACLGLALLSKYTGILLVGTAGLVFLLERRWGRALKLGLGALAVAAPMILWNLSRGGLSFFFQLRHGLGGSRGAVGEFLLGQWAMLGPVFAPLLVWRVARGLRSVTSAEALRGARVLLASIALPFVFFLLASFRTRQEANWPAMAYLAGCALLAGAPGRWLSAAAGVNALVASLGALHLAVAPVDLPGSERALRRLHGWSVLEQLKGMGPRVVYASNYQLASQAWLHSGLAPAVAGEVRRSQFDLWPAPVLVPGDDALWVSRDGEAVPEALASRFSAVEPLEPLVGRFRGRVMHTFTVYRLRQHR